MKHFLSIIIIFFCLADSIAQELKLTVQISAPRLQTVDPKVFETLEKEIDNFMNNTKWTEDEYENFEKIEGNLNITIKEELSPTTFVADFFIQSIRPVYNSNYKSQTLNFVDNGVTFTYRELQPIQNSFNNYIDPLSSLLTYYAYLILGHDYDTFSPFGGDPHFKTTLAIINNVPQSTADGTGWDSKLKDNKSRYQIVEDLLNPRSRPYRQAIYEYHIKSLDQMHVDAGKSRAVMTSAITAVDQVNSAYINSGMIQMFCDSKRKEIIEIFKGAGRGDQTKIYELMIKLDPARANEYSNIK